MNCFKWGICLKKLTVCVLALALILGGGINNFTAYADNATNGQEEGFSDVEGHWAKEQVLNWSKKNLVSGYDDGTFRPERGVTRAEFITFVNRAYGLVAKAQVNFSDVSPQDWFADEVAKAVAADYISGYDDGTMRSAAEISRLEAAVILYKLLRLGSLDNESWSTGFSDAGAIAAWGREYVNSVVAGGYFSGYPDGTFKPNRVISRAETVALLSKAVGTLYNAQGTYGPEEGSETVAGNVTVSVSDVKLQNLVIEGDLFLTAGIGDGDFESDGVVVKGRTIVNGGGEESVVFNNTSLEEVIVYFVDGKVRVVARGDTDIENILLQSGAHLQEDDLDGDGFGDVQILVLKPGENIELEGDFDRVSIETVVDVSVTGDTHIGELEVAKDAEGTTVDTERDTLIEIVTLNGATNLTGQGTIKTANVNTDDYSFEKAPEKIVVDGEEVEEKKKSSGGGRDDVVQVSGVNVNPDIMLLTVEQTETIAVTVSPSNATNKRVTWSSSDNNVATVDANGRVTAVAGGTATITITSVADSTKKATKQVIVGDLLVPANGTIQEVIDDAAGGNTIIIGPGTYKESLTINKQLTLAGSNNLSTIIEGAISISTGNVTLHGLTIDARETYPDYDSAVLSQPDTSGVVTIKNCKIYVDRNGITLLGDQNAVIIDNHILSSASTERCTNGFQTGNLSAEITEEINITLSGNTIMGNEYLVYDSEWYSSGILLKTNGSVTAGNTTLDAGLKDNAETIFDLIMDNNTLSNNDVSCWIFNPETGYTWKMEFGGKRYFVSQLTDLIDDCESKIGNSEEIGEGVYQGKYPEGSIAAFQQVINEAKTILENKDNYSVKQVEEACGNLRAAKTTFESSVYYQYPPTSVGITPAIIFDGETASLEIKLPEVTGEWVAVLVEMNDVQQYHFIQDGGSNDKDGLANSSILFDIVGNGTNYEAPGKYTITVYAANFEITDQAQLNLTGFNKAISVEIMKGPRLDVIYIGTNPAPDGKALFDKLADAIAAIEDEGTIYVQEGEHSIPVNMTINKNIKIIGLGDSPSDTVLEQSEGVSNRYIFNIDAGKSFSISNLTIDGKELASNGIISIAGDLAIQNVVFQNNKNYTARGIYLRDGCYNAVIDDCQLSGFKNTSTGYSSISVSSGFSGTAEILNCSIIGSARGISIGSSDAAVTLSNNTINSSTVGVYVIIGATINDIVSDAANVDEVKTAINKVTSFEGCGTDIQIQ